jgi:hypothetical protein
MEPDVSIGWPDYDSNSPPSYSRFPEMTAGFREWLELVRGAALEALERLQAVLWPPNLCPRIFLSHRQTDRLAALKMAHVVSQCGFHF